MNRKHLFFLSTLLLVADSVRAQGLPVARLQSVFPCGARQGTTVEVEPAGGNLDEPAKLYFSHAGIKAELLPEEKEKTKDGEKAKPRKFKVTVAVDVPVGQYDARLIGKHGISNPRTFVVSDFEEALEKEPNNDRAEATRVALNCTVNGRIGGAEDVDWFVFPAKLGQRVIVECKAWRIDSRLDGFMWLYDAAGKQLATSRDEDIRDEKRDPFIDFDAPADGDYFVKLTDFTYNGSNDYFYRLGISTLPYLDFITPSSAPPGAETAIAVYGRNLPGGEKTELAIQGRPLEKLVQRVKTPSDPEAITGLAVGELVRPWASQLDGMELRVKSGAGSSNAKPLTFSTLPPVDEKEPNDTKAQAQALTVPCSINGRFDVKDADCYLLKAKKDEKYAIAIYASRIGSPADPDMEILKPDDSVAAGAQDFGENIGQLRFTSNTRDIYHAFTAPADGEYTLRLEHLFREMQGGPQYIYRLEVQRDPQPDFRLICQPPDDIRIDSHLLFQGGRERLDILVWRQHGHNLPITVEARNLPKGVTADPIVIGPGVKWGTLVATAAPDAPPGEAEIEIVGTSEVGSQKLVRKARGGVIIWDTVNTPALSRMTRSVVMAVRGKAPFAVTAAPTEMKAVMGEPLNLTVTLKRREDMPNAVQLNGSGYQLPPGLEIPVKSIEPNQTEMKLTLSTEKMKEGTFSFMINGDGQVPQGGDKKGNIRCVYPSNTVKVTIEGKKDKEKEKEKEKGKEKSK